MNEEILTKLKNAGIFKHISSFRPIDKGIDSKNYLISADNKRYVLKIYSSENIEEVKYELEILYKLNLDNKYKKYFPAVKEGIFYIGKNPSIILEYVQGRTLSTKDINLSTIRRVAKIQAQMHRFMGDYVPTHKKFRFLIFDFTFVNFFKNKGNKIYNNILKNEIFFLRQESRRLKKFNLRKTVIHEDLNKDNIIINKNGEIKFIDFGDSHRAEIISDVATAIKELIINNKGFNSTLIKKYLDSYQEVFRINEDEINSLPFLFRRRAVFMINYLLYKQTEDKNTELIKRIDSEIKVLKNLQKNFNSINNFIKNYKYE